MSLVHVYGHQNIRILVSTPTPLASIKVLLDALVERKMAAFLITSAKINAMTIGLSGLHIMPSVSIH